jgi:hypothetical protein
LGGRILFLLSPTLQRRNQRVISLMIIRVIAFGLILTFIKVYPGIHPKSG